MTGLMADVLPEVQARTSWKAKTRIRGLDTNGALGVFNHRSVQKPAVSPWFLMAS